MVDELVRGLGLVPHPEGGFYREMYRASLTVETPRGPRSAGTAIYYLLPRGSFAAWHRVTSDEVWHFYDGHPLELLLVGADGRLERVVMGRDVTKGERPQVVVHAGVLQAAVPQGEYTLVGCTVSPGFDFSDWEMPSAESLAAMYPELSEVMRQLAKGSP
ncbi:cupin domain-containing protein [Pyxidicoccus fallax]|uniref:Cupin domain-containing protein n=1 Tax=Pyxidicoccus fallax TaxID=394095 RepID=A0A848LG85_9BACT|nr:cupin domain-containing protein [Pyxidicoccus fallax]NMO16373.1 cupin domain-containing protein [Pyxidicoccus fallax]NPC78177.1 cupin domain-containing protein [Pyxidicoccus fallax]